MVGAVPTVLLALSFGCALMAVLGMPDFSRWKWFPAALMFLTACLLLGGPLQMLLTR